jgi:polyisoprenoid-binding protein YceI
MTVRTIFSAALLVAGASVAAAQTSVRLPVKAESKVTLDGTSNVHDWTCTVNKVDATIEVDPAAARGDNFGAMLRTVSVRIPVADLKCGKDGMDKNLQKALNSDKHPVITYTLSASDGAVTGSNAATLKTTGTVTVNGVTKTVPMDVATTRLPDGTFRATATVPLQMTDFGVKPVTALLGTIKTGNAVTVKFTLVAGPTAIAER